MINRQRQQSRMTIKKKPPRGGAIVSLFLFLFLGWIVILHGEETATPEPTSSPIARNVRISFLPPPLEGTISLGIYDAKGRLVRILHRESDISEFNIGNDALSTTWDGKDDAGHDLPAGKYSAHGYVVGDLTTEGVGFFFNDWVTAEDAPHILRIRSLSVSGDNLELGVEIVGQGRAHILYDVSHKTIKLADRESAASPANEATPAAAAGTIDPVMTVPGRDGTRWVIDRVAPGASATELKQFSASGEFLRRLSTPPAEPQPIAVAASLTDDRIYLLEENAGAQRVRGLSLAARTEGATPSISDWKVDFEKKITAHKNFALMDGKPVASRPGGDPPPAKVRVRLQANPLTGEDRPAAELGFGFDEDGSFLKTTDGLPLSTISETPDLVGGLVIAHGFDAIDAFQDDGAVVEQFRVTGVDQMMSFDCGGFELK
jgi:hypothetical protein